MDPTRRTLLTGAAILIALGIGFGLAKVVGPKPAHETEAKPEASEAKAGGETVTLTGPQAASAGVAVVTVGRGGASDVRLTGRVEASPDARAAVAAPAAGTVERVLVAPGTAVGRGATLVIIRSADAATVRADAIAAGAQADAARAALAREDRLFKAGVTARQDFEAAQANTAEANAKAVAARARATAFGSPADSGAFALRSPVAGVVTSVSVGAGSFVSPGGLVAEVSDPNRVEAVFNVPPDAAARIKAGMPLRIIGADGGETQAVVIGVAPIAQGSTGAATVRARPTGGHLTPGSAISAALASPTGSLPVVPAEAVQMLNGRAVVFVQTTKGFKATTVTPGRSGGGFTEIVAGLSGGERIAGRGAFLLKSELSKSAGDES
jgi:cobalt-zinc-cadmium efflux system membrane fusion protein